jgi:hypothetical protein
VSSLPSFNTGQGETDSFGVFAYQYGDPGVINSVDVAGFQLPGVFAMALDAYGPSPVNSNG